MPETDTIAPCESCGESKVHKEHNPTACLKRKLMGEEFPAGEFVESDENEVRHYPSTNTEYLTGDTGTSAVGPILQYQERTLSIGNG